ncbi:hypothetical protein KLP40_19385 [Hymenobacter sp. NST-14]|uniref:hypothetical protein n=1 Tax=Hymenobacter piscis TaxID=2839984 RepID=UPI001C02A36B|nr:hypothetical protein [Hymenobacter piscis]MBT9395339.1 hypothetical protein [Hymenobacter piscis]
MKTSLHAAAPLKVAAALPAYAGSITNFLQKQAEAQAAESRRVAVLNELRRGILVAVADPYFFNPDEQQRTQSSVARTQCADQLQRWLRNVTRVADERETALRMSFADGTCTFLLVSR